MEVHLSRNLESLMLVRLIMKSIQLRGQATGKTSAASPSVFAPALKGLYSHNGLLYFTPSCATSPTPFDIDFITFKIVDKKVAKQTTCRSRCCFQFANYTTCVWGARKERTVFNSRKVSPSPDDKQLIVRRCTRRTAEDTNFVGRTKTQCAREINEPKVK